MATAAKTLSDHPKLRGLALKLDIPLYAATGVVISCWDYIGRYGGSSAAEWIEDWMGWTGTPGLVVPVLIECGFLDVEGVNGVRPSPLLVHLMCPSKSSRRWQWMKLAGGDLSEETRIRIFSRDDWKCVECGTDEDLTIDHIVAVTKGGTNDEANLRTLCRSHNASKGNR